ncbi:hypothetical protein PWT90_02189 [Aphanocladium album]|nr:hypothetical protein PWT90_02189 [Aphanocladium album]
MNGVFLGVLNAQHLPVRRDMVVTEVLVAVAYLYDAIAVTISTCLVALVKGKAIAISGLIAEFFPLAVSVYTLMAYRSGFASCSSYEQTPFGYVDGNEGLPTVVNSCGMQKGIATLMALTTCGTIRKRGKD